MHRISVSIFCVTIFFYFGINFSQTIDQFKQKEEEKKETSGAMPKQFDIDFGTRERTTEFITPSQQYYETILDKEIDSSVYVLGPGDMLSINIFGPLDSQIPVEITPDGYVVVPGIFETKLSGLTLKDASDKILMNLTNYFRDTLISVRLTRIRKFPVYAVGEFKNAGTYYLRGSNRLSDLIEIAQGYSYGADETRIEIRRTTGEVKILDISEFYRFGKSENNPYLQGGDIVFIPSIDLAGDYVEVEGNIDPPGFYQLRKNETLHSLMIRLKLLSRGSDVQNVLLVRDGQKYSFDLVDDLQKVKEYYLQKSDHIFISSVKEYVYVVGEVRQPGAFPYLAQYTSKDYAGLAGLTDNSQSTKNIFVVRAISGKKERGGNVVVEKGDLVVIPQRQRENVKDILAILTPIISITLSTIAIVASTR